MEHQITFFSPFLFFPSRNVWCWYLLCRAFIQEQPVRVWYRRRDRMSCPQRSVLLPVSPPAFAVSGHFRKVISTIQRPKNGSLSTRTSLCRWKTFCWRAYISRIRSLPRGTSLSRIFSYLSNRQARNWRGSVVWTESNLIVKKLYFLDMLVLRMLIIKPAIIIFSRLIKVNQTNFYRVIRII